jgi:PAS domain S-box-containing protein
VSGPDGVEAQAALRGIQQVLAGAKGAFTLTYPCDSPTEPRWFEMRVLPLSGPQPGAVIAHEEITARMLAQEALRASEQRLQRVLDGTNDGFWDWDVVTGDVFFSRRWAEMLGYDLTEIRPHVSSWETLVHPDDLPGCRTALQSHFSGETPYYQTEHRMRARDGEWRWILDRGMVTARDTEGRPLWMAGTHTDITERRQMEEALRVSLAEVRRHDAQMVALNQMNDLLLSCRSREEAYAVIADSAEALFVGLTGALAVVDETGAELHRVAAWGDPNGLSAAFSLHHCWGLRRGQSHEVGPLRADIDCQHFPEGPPPTSLCIPLTVRGATLGLLHVSTRETLTEAQFRELRTLAITVSESIKLALSNLKLQEGRQDQR